ncbi:GDP-fucose protein O-fucosyltransferase [Cynara cardunculus var. scolymus]|uniref:O-fucosyltransferase family protein n=1 Tax=Cynara cardunculus var. scolymus TaxID=59895 RepID=A0A118JZX2_CYNCS|nr:GDP-fucose protein O-fucosyltransferase [Cynara cardunculus var. scolymus]
MRRPGEGMMFKRPYNNRHQLKQVKGLFNRFTIVAIILVIMIIYFFVFASKANYLSPESPSEVDMQKLWYTADSGGWRPSSTPRSYWPPPPNESNGYLRICNAVLAARIMNATLVLPELDTNSYWHDDSGFQGIYDVDHFISSLRYDVRIVESIPEIRKNGKIKKIKSFQLRPPRDAPISWYSTVALEKMNEHGAIYLTPFSHRLAEEIDNPEYQRLRCRVNYHALRFKQQIMQLSQSIVAKLRSQGHFMSIHLRFEKDMLSCFDIFSPQEQKILRKYRKENFADKKLVYRERRAIGKCPLTPEEPFRAMFPLLENHNTVDPSSELTDNTQGLLGSAVDYMVCLLSDIFVPTYDGPSNFANNLLGHRLYYSFRTTIRPDRKGLAPIFIQREEGHLAGFEAAVRRVMMKTNFGGPRKRVPPESFYTNSWPECFCRDSATDPGDRCPPDNMMEVLEDQLEREMTNVTSNGVMNRVVD